MQCWGSKNILLIEKMITLLNYLGYSSAKVINYFTLHSLLLSSAYV